MEDYVKLIDARSIQIVVQAPNNVTVVQALGAVAVATNVGIWRIDYGTEEQLARIVQALRDAGLAFGGGTSGWPPAAVAESLREKGKLHGEIRIASWSGPNQQTVKRI